MTNNEHTYNPKDLEQWIIDAVEEFIGELETEFDIPEDKLRYDVSLFGVDRGEKTIKYIILLN